MRGRDRLDVVVEDDALDHIADIAAVEHMRDIGHRTMTKRPAWADNAPRYAA